MKKILINKKNYVFKRYIFLVSLIILIILYTMVNLKNSNVVPSLTFFLIGISSILGIALDDKNISVFFLVQVFILIFFYFVGFTQYYTDSYPWPFLHSFDLNDKSIIKTNLIILCFNIIFSFTYFFASNMKKKNKIINEEFSSNKITLLSIINCLILFIIIFIYGLDTLLGLNDKLNISLSQPVYLIFDRFIRMIPFGTSLLLLNIYSKTSNKKVLKHAIFNICLSMVLLFPFGGVSRYCSAAVLIGFFFLFIEKRFRSNSFILLFTILGIIVIFPFLEFFRYNSFLDLFESFEIKKFDYSSGHFDSYFMTHITIQYTDNNGIAFGKNILNALLFFVPSSLWSGKWPGTGSLIAEPYNKEFSNVSCSLIAEIYFGFGLVGIIIFAFILGVLIKKIDTLLCGSDLLFKIIAILILCFTIFIMRGDLLSSFAYLLGAVCSTLIPYFVISKRCVKLK